MVVFTAVTDDALALVMYVPFNDLVVRHNTTLTETWHTTTGHALWT